MKVLADKTLKYPKQNERCLFFAMFKAGHASLTVIEGLLFSIQMQSDNPLQKFTTLFA